MHAESTVPDMNPVSQDPPPCAHCGRAIQAPYYLANDAVTCATCRPEVVRQLTGGSSAGRFARALAFGLLAAGVGATLYFAILALTGYEIGLVAIIVGLIVGKAVHAGSRGRGGLGYQALAVALTYSAIVVTYIPFILSAAEDQWAVEELANGNAAEPPVMTGDAIKTNLSELQPKSAAVQIVKVEPEPIGAGELALGIGFLFVFAAAAPVLAGVENIMGLLIIGFALHQAWTMNKQTDQTIQGPFPLSGENAA